MDNTIAGLLGAVAGLATAATAHAAISPAPMPQTLEAPSYADLLAPIANPIELLRADDAARVQQPAAEPAADFEVVAAQHHHHHYSRNSHHHHHQRYSHNYHHHHHHPVFGIPGFGVVVNGR